ncbi:MAG: zinc ABC transporter substrate-binding protein [Candidatus Magasanikbacteria bacterium]
MSKTSNYKFTIAFCVILIISILTYLFIKTDTGQLPINELNPRLQITTSFYPLYFFTSQIVQNKADVFNITPAGAEPHDYEPTTKDMMRIENSQLLIINGGRFEAWADNVQNIIDKPNFSIVNIEENLAPEDLIGDNVQTRDPHFWLNPVLVKKEVEIITNKIVATDPSNADFYINNSKILLDKLEILNNQYKTGLSNCQKKDIITAHSAFAYLAREYGLTETAVAGLSPDEEPSPKKLAEVANFAQKNQVQYIFFESLVSPKLADTIAQEIGAKTLVLNPLEGLTDEEIKNGKTYFTEMTNNLNNLKTALQCL